MASKHAFGLAKIEYGEIAVDGDIATTWTEIGETNIGSCTLTSTDPQVTKIFVEEFDSAIESTVSTPAEISLVLSTPNVAPDQLAALYGGAVVSGAWEAPDQLPELEYSWRVTDKKGGIWTIPRGKSSSKLNVSFTRDKVGQLDISVEVLQPSKTGVKRIKYVPYA